MPRPVPPPPPQPSAEETRVAVRHVLGFALLALVLFWGWGSTYGNDALTVQYGRDNAASWNLRKAGRINPERLRAHRGGKIAWLVGSSILRESFDERRINRALEGAKSEWRVRKFGQTRGAGGLSAGMLERLPVQSGDMVIHNVAAENFRADWVGFSGLPDWRLMLMLDDAQMWDIEEWSPAQKIEAWVAFPRDFYRYQEEVTEGFVRWGNAIQWGVPKKRRRSFHTRFRKPRNAAKMDPLEAEDALVQYRLASADLDFSATQFNLAGIARMRRFSDAQGARFVLLDVPQQQAYRDDFVDADAWTQFRAWCATRPELVVFPQVPDRDFYDMKHPAKRGRALLGAYLVHWLDADPVVPPDEFVTRWQQSQKTSKKRLKLLKLSEIEDAK